MVVLDLVALPIPHAVPPTPPTVRPPACSWSAHVRPFNSGLMAGEALVSPFFGAAQVQHARLPVCTEAAFPRSS